MDKSNAITNKYIMVTELTENFVPSIFPHREEQISEVKEVFENFKTFGYGGSNLLLSGGTGAGKTSMIKRIMEEENGNWIFASGSDNNTANKILKKLAGISSRNKSTGEVVEELTNQLNTEKRIIIIDEIHKVRDLTVFINFLNGIFKKTTTPLIAITNKFTFVQSMPRDAQLTLFFNKIKFDNYDQTQLFDIIMQRIEIIVKKGEINWSEDMETGVKYICVKTVNECDSSARIALDMTLKSIMKNDFTQEFVNKYVYNLSEQSFQNFVQGINNTEKEFLQAIIELTFDKEEITSSDIHSQMEGSITPSRISQLITAFIDDYDILSAKYQNLGRGHGRYRLVQFKSPEMRNRIVQHVTPYYAEE